MAPLAQAVKWPVISWVVVDVVFLLTGFVEGVLELLTPAVVAPLAVAFGVWAGYKMIEFGGNYIGAIVAGAIVGAACAILTLVLGVVHAMPVIPMAVLSLALNLNGALVGAGFALTRPTPAG